MISVRCYQNFYLILSLTYLTLICKWFYKLWPSFLCPLEEHIAYRFRVVCLSGRKFFFWSTCTGCELEYLDLKCPFTRYFRYSCITYDSMLLTRYHTHSDDQCGRPLSQLFRHVCIPVGMSQLFVMSVCLSVCTWSVIWSTNSLDEWPWWRLEFKFR